MTSANELCDEIGDACGYNEHKKCDGMMSCPAGYGRHHCECACHWEQ